MIKVYHPSAWKANYPTKPRFWLSIQDCLRDNPGLTEREVSSTPYIGPQTAEFIVLEEPKKPEVPLEALVQTKAILDAAPVPQEDRVMPEVSAETAEALTQPAPEVVPEPAKLTPAQKRAATLAAKKAAKSAA